jgi:hypothetical protein
MPILGPTILIIHEIEHDAGDTRRHDYKPCEIPPDSYRDDQ